MTVTVPKSLEYWFPAYKEAVAFALQSRIEFNRNRNGNRNCNRNRNGYCNCNRNVNASEQVAVVHSLHTFHVHVHASLF